MRLSLASCAAGAAILLLLSAGFALSVREAAQNRSEQALNLARAGTADALSRAAHKLDMSGRKALSLVRQTDDFSAALGALGRSSSAWLTIDAVASFEPRDGAPALRRAEPVFAEGAPPPPGIAEHVVGLRADALSAAKSAAPLLKSPSPEAVLVQRRPGSLSDETQGDRNQAAHHFWLIWGGGDERAVAVRGSLRAEIKAMDASQARLATFYVDMEPDAQGSELATPTPAQGRAVARLGDHLVRVSSSPLEVATIRSDYLTALEIFGPTLACGLLLGCLFLSHARRAEARAAEDSRRNAEMLTKIEAKQSQLEESEERFRHLAESTKVIPWTADLENQRFTYIGPQIQALSGFSAADWRASGFWAQHIHPNDRQRVLVEEISKVSAGRYATLDYRVRAANGRILYVRNMLSVREHRDEKTGRKRPVAHGFLLDVTEMRRAAAALEVARRRAEEANRVKSEFLANMSHELRTPLNAVIGFSEIMKDQLFGPLDERYREYAESVHASGRHLLSLINDVLDLSKIEAGRVELSEEETNVAEMLKDCRTLLKERMDSAGLRCIVKTAPGLPAIRIDERRIKQVILNLVSNSIKFTEPGGEVEIGAERLPGQGMRLWVRDTGCGMREEDIPKALAKFGQVDGNLDRQHQGTGLGLPIAKSLVEMHGGSFEIRSREGEGTMIALKLPEQRVVRAPGAVRSAPSSKPATADA